MDDPSAEYELSELWPADDERMVSLFNKERMEIQLGITAPLKRAKLSLDYMSQGLYDVNPNEVPHGVSFWLSGDDVRDLTTAHFRICNDLKRAASSRFSPTRPSLYRRSHAISL